MNLKSFVKIVSSFLGFFDPFKSLRAVPLFFYMFEDY